jgi:CRP/FNR family transcriptional regulator
VGKYKIVENADWSRDEQLRLLSWVDIFEGLPEEELEELSRRCPDTQIERNETFYTPDEHGERLFLLKEGRVQVHKEDPTNREAAPLKIVNEGTIFGDMTLTGQRLEDVYVTAKERSTLCTIKKRDLENLILRNPEVGLKLARLLGERLRQCEQARSDLIYKEVPARLASLLLRLVESEGVVNAKGFMLPTRYTHRELGSMIGAKRVAVTRALKKLREQGAVEPKDGHVYVTDQEALESAASSKKGE